MPAGHAAFSPDYATARERFLDAARRAGAGLDSIAVTPTGPRGEPLFIDLATLGSSDADAVVIVTSGLHGIEGFFGSAVQLAWLERQARRAHSSTKVVLAHAVNPFGFAWLRRSNEHNVDLNRNFLVDTSFLTGEDYRTNLAVYEHAAAFLNPPSPPSRWEPYMLKAVSQILRTGLKALRRALPAGQYAHERGLFYGGRAPEETTTLLRGRLPAWIDRARLAVHLDLHTGLGRWAERRLFVVDPAGSPRAEWVAARFGPEVRAPRNRAMYQANGSMAQDFRERALPCVYHGITADFGTYSDVRVIRALRAENRAHFYASPNSAAYAWARDALREAFAPRSQRWRDTVVGSGVALIDQAIDACREEQDLDLGRKTGQT